MYLLFDIGGTKTRLAISRDKKSFIAYEIFDTPPNFEEGMGKINEYLKRQGIGIQGVVGGIAGVMEGSKTKLTFSPNLEGWIGHDLKSRLSEISGADLVIVENDAALNGLGEAVYGAGKDFRIVAYLTISTGVGGTRIVDRKIDSANFNFEPGHQLISVKNMLCSDDLNCRCDEETSNLESFISGAALEKKYGQKLKDLQDEKIWDRIYHYLAIGLTNVSVFWSPQVIILGGGVAGSELFSFERLETHFRKTLKVYPEIPHLMKGVLSDHAGLYGALEILKQS
jgi:predicted NBD/HSP70 family sugar kinase